MQLTPLIRARFKAALVRAFTRDERGATAVELALLAIPFFALVGAILQTSLAFLAAQILDGAVQDSSRLIRTGQEQNITPPPSDAAATYQAAICDRLFNLFDCTQLHVSVTVISNFSSATTSSPLDPTDPTKWTLAPAYNPGTGSSIVMVQAYYKWPTFFNLAGFNFATSSDGTRLLGSVRVFENEPFTS